MQWSFPSTLPKLLVSKYSFLLQPLALRSPSASCPAGKHSAAAEGSRRAEVAGLARMVRGNGMPWKQVPCPCRAAYEHGATPVLQIPSLVFFPMTWAAMPQSASTPRGSSVLASLLYSHPTDHRRYRTGRLLELPARDSIFKKVF